MRERASGRQRMGILMLSLLVLSLTVAPRPAAASTPEPPFRRTGRGFHFRGLEVAASGPSLAVSGGRVVQRMGQRHLRLGELAPAIITEPNFLLHGKPGIYRTAIVIRTPGGRKLTEFGNYYRVIRPTVHGRLASISEAYSPGDTLFARLENPGAAFVLFGEEFEIEKLEGEAWVPAGLPGAYTMPLYFVAPGTTSATLHRLPDPRHDALRQVPALAGSDFLLAPATTRTPPDAAGRIQRRVPPRPVLVAAQ